jgi:hypothetical protein
MARFQMALHGGYRVTYQAKRHVPVRRRLVLNEHVNVAVTTGGFQAVEDVAEILAEVILNERAGFQFQRAEVADGLQLSGQCNFIKSRAISGCVRNCLNVASWGVGVLFFFIISPGSEK